MPRITGPGFGLEASGSLGKNITYQRRKSGTAMIRYSKPGDRRSFEVSLAQIRQRMKIALLIAQWQGMTAPQKEVYENLAKSSGFRGTGYSYFIKVGQMDFYTFNGLTSHYDLNEDSGNTIYDLANSPSNGVLGPTYPSDSPVRQNSKSKYFKKALYFDGVDDIVNITNSAKLNPGPYQDFTYQCMINCPAQNAGVVSGGLIHKGGGLTSVKGAYISIGGGANMGKLRCVISDGITRINANYGNKNLCDGKWHLVTCTFDRDGMMKVYYDGVFDVQVDISAIAGSNLNYNSPLQLGYRYVYYYKGIIDEVRIYNRVLPLVEIQKQVTVFAKSDTKPI